MRVLVILAVLTALPTIAAERIDPGLILECERVFDRTRRLEIGARRYGGTMGGGLWGDLVACSERLLPSSNIDECRSSWDARFQISRRDLREFASNELFQRCLDVAGRSGR